MSSDPRPAKVLGDFTLGGILGSGGFGTVYRATDGQGRKVALKVLAPHADSEETIARFRREGEIRIEHPNVVKVVDAGQDQGVSYIAFELLEGVPLNKRLEHAPLPIEEVVDIGRQICAGLRAAHERNIVHRDLKPGNVFVCEDGTVKILDFGIARPMSQAGPQLTMAGSVIGTPGYLSPEQAKGDVDIRPSADLWSLGVILFQAVAGKNPFIRTTAVATILAVVLEEAPTLGEDGEALVPGFAEIVQGCLAKDPSKRWCSATELGDALASLDLSQSAVAAEPPPSAPVSLPMDEQRVVALVLATEVHDLPALRRAVREWGGESIPMLGGAVGVFGGRTYEGDETVRAVQAALEARDSAGFVAVAAGRATGAGGAVSGDAVDAVERAVEARLKGVAVDTVAARGLEAHFELRRISEHVFEVPRALSRRETGRFPTVRDDLPLLGREAELAQLERAVEAAFDEARGTVLWMSGPPGIGKSRLRGELERRLRQRGVHVLAGRGESHRRGAAFHLIAGALRSEPMLEPFFLNPGVSVGRRRRALSDFLTRVLEDEVWARQCTEPLGRLMGFPDDYDTQPARRRSDPQLLADKLRVSLADVIGTLARKGPLALVLDDVQWADDSSLSLLEELAGRLTGERLLVCLAARPELDERAPELFHGQDVLRIRPRGLSEREVASLAEAIAGRALRPAIARQIAARTEGNPFFVEQIVREIVEQDLFDRPIEELPIPLDVEGAVQSRLDHLPSNEKQLCKRAAVLTSGFTGPALRALEQPEPERHLGALAKRGLVADAGGGSSRGPDEREYRFRNALVADVAYRMNSEEARRALHRLAASFLEGMPGSDREELARHWERGGEPAKAARAYVEATLAASKRGDSPSVLRCSERAIALGVDDRHAFELHVTRADALFFLGDKAAQRASIETALELAGSTLERARALVEKGALLVASGAQEEGLRLAEEAVAAARVAGDPDLLALALARLGWGLLYAGRVSDASVPIGEAAAMPGLSRETAAMVAAWRGQLFTAMGDLGKRKAALEEAVAAFRAIGDLRRAATSECNLADTFNRVGAYEEAEAALREAVASCRRVGNRVVEGYALANLGYALAGRGLPTEARVAFDEALALATELGRPRLAVAARLYRARASLAQDNPFEVADEARRVAAEAEATGLPALAASALALASRAALEGDDPEGALADAERAMELRDEIGTMEEDEAEIFLALAEALRALGQTDRAREVVARGASRLEFLAGRIEDTSWRARFLVEVPVNRRLIELDGDIE